MDTANSVASCGKITDEGRVRCFPEVLRGVQHELPSKPDLQSNGPFPLPGNKRRHFQVPVGLLSELLLCL